MAKKIEETMAFVNSPDNLMSFGKSFATLNGQPLDKSSIFSSKAKAEEYARSASAYVGKIVVVAEGTSGQEIVTAYVINSDNTLKPIGDKGTMDDLADRVAGLEDNFTGNDANNALSLGGKAASEYQLASELKALAKKDQVAKSDLTTELSAELDAKAVAETVNAELAKKAVKEDVDKALDLKADKTYTDEQLGLKATVVAQEATEAKAQENKETIAAMDTAYKAADTALEEKITGLDTRVGTAESDIDALELKVQNVTNVMDFRGAYDTLPDVAGFDNGDVIVIKMPADKKKKDIDSNAGKEFVCVEENGVKSWVEFGNSNANQAAIAKLQEADKAHDQLLAGLEANKATKDEVNTLSGKIDKKAEQSALDTAVERITAVEGEVDTLNAKPAFGITSDQISNWDKEVGAKAIADANKLAIDNVDTGLAKAHEKIGVNAAAIAENAEAIKTKANDADLTALENVVNDPVTGLAATKAIADQNKIDIAAEKGALDKAKANEETLKTKANSSDVTALTGRIDDLEKVPAHGITTEDIEAWNTEKGAHALAATKASQDEVNTLSGKIDAHDGLLEGLRTDVDTKQTVAQVNELIAGANISTDKIVNGSEILVLNGGAAK